MRKILKSKETQKVQVPPEEFRPVIITTDTMKGLNDADYIAKNGLPEELASLRAAIERRKAAGPQYAYYVCSRCGWKAKMPFGVFETNQRVRCPACNAPGYADGGWLTTMNAKEIASYEKDVREDHQKGIERMRRQAYASTCESRQRQGLSPLKYEAWLKERTRGRA